MVQRTHVLLIDDLDGGEAHETVQFGIDGQRLEIDLANDNATALREVLAQYVEAGRRISGELGRPRRARQKETEVDPTAVRAWAEARGIRVSKRGRIPASVVAQFREAGN